MVLVLLECILSCMLFFMLIRSYNYFGAMPVMHLNAVMRILYSILCCMGSQGSFFSAHDELEYLFSFRISLVQMFFCFLLMCFLKFRCWSRNPPRYLTALLTAIGSPWALSGSGDVFLSCFQEPKRMYSLLSEFSFRHIASIQHFSYVNTSSRSVLVLSSSTLLPALKLLHIEWSLANAVSAMELLI